MCTPYISSVITKLYVIQKPQFGGQFLLLVSFFTSHNHLSSAITTFKVSAQRAIHGSKGGCNADIPVTHTRGQLSWVPLPHTPLFQGSWDLFSVPLHEFQTKSQASPCAESFFKRLINLLGMSQERWAISLGEIYLRMVVCGCICMLVSVCSFVCISLP